MNITINVLSLTHTQRDTHTHTHTRILNGTWKGIMAMTTPKAIQDIQHLQLAKSDRRAKEKSKRNARGREGEGLPVPADYAYYVT